MNPLYATTKKGTIGELFVQLRLLEHDVQAAPPVKDSGNDLIAIRGNIFKAIQVRTTSGNTISKPRASIEYDILAVVRLSRVSRSYSTRDAVVYLFQRSEVSQLSRKLSDYSGHRLSQSLIDRLFR